MKRIPRLHHWFLFLGILLFSVLLLAPLQANAANMPLEITNIKPAGTGSPAISPTHRIFYAYPGIEYKIRAAVVGGEYPYIYSLSNAPTGMTVDAAGYIRWPNPQTNANNIGLRITDSVGSYIDTTWSISVQISGFGFVSVNGASNGNGALATPYNSIANMVAGATSNDIIYFRAGEYALPARGGNTIGSAQAFQFNTPSNTASRWLSYPGEKAVVNLTNNRYFLGESSNPFYFDGLVFKNGREYFFRTSSGQNYVTFLDNTFETLTIEREGYNSNQGTYFTFHNGTGYFLTFQGNFFSGYRDTQGIGSLYDQNTILVENNHFTDFTDANTMNQVLAFKVGIVNLTLRGNIANLSASCDFGLLGGSTNGQFTDGTPTGHGPKSENIEVLYNYFRHAGSGLVQFNRLNNQGTTWVYRNTFVSPLQMTHLADSDCDGPWVVNNNIFQNSTSGISYHYSCEGDYTACVSQTGNVGAMSGVVDLGGLLTADYSSQVGVAGWQFSDGSTPMGRPCFPVSPPKNLKIIK